jgi:hypothetical protein
MKLRLAPTMAFVLAAAAGVLAESHVRIVRLSYINGQVQTDRATGGGLERAILNTPITQGVRIVTGNDGLAEVEFENESALRIAENSEIQFLALSMNEYGAKTNEIDVVKGVVYLDARSKGDIYRLKTGDSTFLVQRDTQLRLSANGDQTLVSVFKGNVELADQSQMVNVKRKETITVDRTNPLEYKIATGAEALPTDAWNQEREAYQQAYANNPGNPGPRAGYGLQDLNYYGSFFMANGYGYVWQPYGFANSMLGWDPYSSGAWIFCPGLGYSFASQYPWGWLPYHYGSWAFLKGVGWAWIPGGGYSNGWYSNGFQAAPVVAKAPSGWTAPASPSVASTQSVKPTVMVGKASSSAYIPGGRIAPAFSSVIREPGVGPNAVGKVATSADARNRAVNEHTFANNYNAFGATHTSYSGHVFVAPAPASAAALAGPAAAGPGYGTSAHSGGAVPAVSSGHASSGHSSGPSHH